MYRDVEMRANRCFRSCLGLFSGQQVSLATCEPKTSAPRPHFSAPLGKKFCPQSGEAEKVENCNRGDLHQRLGGTKVSKRLMTSISHQNYDFLTCTISSRLPLLLLSLSHFPFSPSSLLKIQDDVFNCFRKWKTSCNQPQLLLKNQFKKAPNWLSIFFILVLKMGRNG